MKVLWLSLVCSVLLVACSAAEPTRQPSVPASTVSVAMLADVGGLEDASFNEVTYAGLSATVGRLGLAFTADEAESVEQYQAGITTLAEAGHNIIVTVGIQMSDPTLAIAADFPDIHFIGVDQFQVEAVPNVTGVVFPNDQAGYLAGVLAASLSETGTIGGVYGPDVVEPVVAFAAGYEAGALSVNPDITVLTEFYPGPLDTGFRDLAWGAATAEAHIDADADVVFAAAGDTGNGAIVAVANRTTEDDPRYCIGVDTDQWFTVRDARPCLVSSAVKNIPRAVDEVIVQILDDSPPSGNYTGPISLAPFHDFEAVVPADVVTLLEETRTALNTGDLNTGYTPE